MPCTSESTSIDRMLEQHRPAGVVGPNEATDWAWDNTPMPPDRMIVLLAIARHVRMSSLDGLPSLLMLDARTVQAAVLDLIAAQLLCPSTGGGVHVTLDCNCVS